MSNDINSTPPYIEDFKGFATKYKKEIKSFESLATTYEKSLIELEKANNLFDKKHDYLKVFQLPDDF